MVCGVPEGITDEFVYEFKTTANNFLLRYMLPYAFAQADLYGLLFKRKRKRVQIRVRETGEVKTWFEEVDKNKAEETLDKLWRMVQQGLNAPKPKPWKCKSCEFREECAVK